MSSSNDEVRFALETDTPRKERSLRKLIKARSTTTIFLTILTILLLLFILLFIFKKADCPTTPSDTQTEVSAVTRTWQAPRDDLSDAWNHLRLPHSLLPSSYHIHFLINLSSFIFTGNTSIYITASDNIAINDHVILHAVDLTIPPETVDIRQVFPVERDIAISKCNFSLHNELYVIKLRDHVIESGNRYILSFRSFSGVISNDLKGLYRSSYRTSNGKTRYLALTQLQSIDARRVYPCFDEPNMKAVFHVSITHQAEYTALSNMQEGDRRAEGEGWVSVRYAPTPRMATYLLALLVSDFTMDSVVNKHGLLIRVWSRKDMERQRSYALETIKKSYEFFADYFNCTELLNKTDHAAVPDFGAGAMENWGLVLYRETSMLQDLDSYSFTKNLLVSLITAHEIAHTWFGNMVTMTWWDDLWLNEGFANTLMYFPINHHHPDWKVFDFQLVSSTFPVMIRDSLNTSKALSTPIVHQDNITNNFDVISYDKGMAVLRMLYGFLGWNNFRDGLRVYIQDFTFSNANITQIWNIFERSSSTSFKVKDILDTWTHQMGFPVVTVSKIGANKYKLQQQKCELNSGSQYNVTTSPYGYKWVIPFTYVVEGDKQVKTQWMNMTSAEISLPDDKWLLGNVDSMGMFRVNYPLQMWQRLIAQLQHDHTVFSAASRSALINDAFNLARSGLLPYHVPFDMCSYLSREEEYAPWHSFSIAIEFIIRMLPNSNSYGKLNRFIRSLVEPKYKQLNSTTLTDPTLINLKDVLFKEAVWVGVEEAQTWAQEKFDAWMENKERIPPEHESDVYNLGVSRGGEEVWDAVWNETRVSLVAADTETFYTALAFATDSWLLWRYARRTLSDDLIKTQDIHNVHASFLATPLGQSVLLSFLITHWEQLCNKFENDAFMLRNLVATSMKYVNTHYHYQQLNDLYSRRPPPGVVVTIFEDGLSLIRSNINWMEQNHDAIEAWLDANVT